MYVDVVMLGLAGFRVLGAVEEAGEVELWVETTARRVGCSECGVVAVSHGRREVVVRDVAAFGRPVRLWWRKRLWRCHEPLCGRVTWTEEHDEVATRASLTDRARAAACRRVGKGGESVAVVARDYGVGGGTP